MLAALRRRYLDVLASVYIYNEHRGYSSLDRVLEAVRAKYPEDLAFIAKVEKHRADERKHYVMFRRYFESLGRMPYEVDRTCGHIDRLIREMSIANGGITAGLKVSVFLTSTAIDLVRKGGQSMTQVAPLDPLAALNRLDKRRSVMEAFMCTGVQPSISSSQFQYMEITAIQIDAINVGDLQLAPRRRL